MIGIIEKMFYGNLRPCEQESTFNPEILIGFERVEKIRKQLESALSDEQKKLLYAYTDEREQLAVEANKNHFVTGFRMGMSLTIDGMLDHDL